jgi:hypothetical protein
MSFDRVFQTRRSRFGKTNSFAASTTISPNLQETSTRPFLTRPGYWLSQFEKNLIRAMEIEFQQIRLLEKYPRKSRQSLLVMGFEHFATQNPIALPGKNFDRFQADYPTTLSVSNDIPPRAPLFVCGS